MIDEDGLAHDDATPADADGSGPARRQAHAERERSHRIGSEAIRPEAPPRETKKPRDDDAKKNAGDDEDEQHDDHASANRDDSDDDDGDSDGKKKSGKGQSDEKKKPDDAKPKKWSTAKRLTVFGIVAAVLVLATIGGVLYWLHARQFQKTDDAFVDAHYEMVAPQVGGRVIRVLTNDNALVEPGQVVLEIDPADYRVAIERAVANVAAAESSIAQARAQRDVAAANVEQAKADVDVARSNLENAQSELRRYEGLSKEAVSPQRLDDLRTTGKNAAAQLVASEKRASAQAAQVELADSQILAAEANAKSARAQQAQAELNLSYATVKATTGGRVAQRNVQAGDYVSPGQQLLILVPRDVYVTANYKETQITDMRPGQEVEIAIDAFPDQTFRGKVDSIQRGSGTIFSLLPPQNATGNYVKVVQRVPVKIVFDDKTGEVYERLGPGMSVMPSVKIR